VATAVEGAGEGVHIEVAVGAEGDLGRSVGGLAEEDGELGPLDGAGVVDDAVEVVGRGVQLGDEVPRDADGHDGELEVHLEALEGRAE
jgi:hypothetical protein